ncbi:hypothetical protein BMS3Abin02_00704 [bacterium BMS3Abin02]|nr:hypothetical protein BMS3Abin02_00704 [bacterium BMS3Abin02]
MRELAVVALLGLFVACSSTVETAPPPAITPSTRSPSTTAPISITTTTTPTTTAPSPSTTPAPADGPPSVDMVPTGYEIEDFLPLVEGYFAVRNWALEHPDQVTEEILATVIEPGSVEMRDTLAEIQDLLDQDAHYEGLTETFVLREARFAYETSQPRDGTVQLSVTTRYGSTDLLGNSDLVLMTDSLRALVWTIEFIVGSDEAWRVSATLRNEPIYPKGDG